MIVVPTAELYPDPQLPSTSAATTSVTTTKTPNKHTIEKKICLLYYNKLYICDVQNKNILIILADYC